ncbi:MAG TPA: chromosomal replication initiator protein DnaA [Candidatus Onthomonas avicola]|nr:chromosomal replication initiator protein DnaA [Candidatus Onthomonas avicola]
MNSAADIWASAVALLEKELTPTAVSTWFYDAEAMELREDQLVLCVPTEFKKNIILSRYLPHLKKVLYDLFAADMDVVIFTKEEADRYRAQGPRNENVLIGNEEFTFEHFIVGSSNQFAYNAALNVANNPGRSYNPLFIYGESGLGKTHLLYAIYHTIRKSHPDFNIIFIKGDEFTNELQEAIRLKSTDAFRQKYRDKDLLLVDDIQFIAGKESTQEEFFNTFNNLYESGHQIVLTSDRPPSDMARLENRLRTRFEWGLLADIQPPDYETRCAIIKNKAILLGLELPNDVLEYIAQNITSNVRQLEGTIKRLLAYRDLMGQKVNDENASRAIQALIRARDEYIPSPEIIVEETAKYYALEPKAVLGSSRMKEVVLARQVSIYLIRSITNLSLPEIGKVFGQHHTTVMHSLDKVEKMMKDDRHLTEVIRDIKSNINSRGY